MSEPSAELLHVEGPCFPYRFPQYGTDERKNAWKQEYKNWWQRQFRKAVDEVENGWLTSEFLAQSALAHHNLSPRVIEAAVSSPTLEVSELTVRKQRLSVEDFAAALAHPLVSIFDLLDADGVAPEAMSRYLDNQTRLRTGEDNSKTLEYLIEAQAMARKIVAKRNQPFTIK
jgi:hypothetical protein